MTPDEKTDPTMEEREELASVDDAAAAELAHEERRAADAKQGLIERETRRHKLDEG